VTHTTHCYCSSCQSSTSFYQLPKLTAQELRMFCCARHATAADGRGAVTHTQWCQQQLVLCSPRRATDADGGGAATPTEQKHRHWLAYTVLCQARQGSKPV
jgi:hypothetical protein